jgi:hypothetical protein
MSRISLRSPAAVLAGLVRIGLMLGAGLGPGGVAMAQAGAQVEIGYVRSYDGTDFITSDYIPWLIDFYFEDGSKGNLTNSSNNLILLAQCYAGDYLVNYNGTAHDADAGGEQFDSATFSNTTVLTNDVPGRKTQFHTADHLVKSIFRGRTAGDLQTITSDCKEVMRLDDPQLQGLATRAVGGATSTHVLVWASQPDPRDIANIGRIAQRFPPSATTTVTVLSGNGTAAHTGTQVAGVTYGAATRSALEDAIETIGARMDDGADEQFILIMLDHGGKAVIDPTGIVIIVADPPTPGARSFTLTPSQEMLVSIRENAPLCNPILDPGCQPYLGLFTTLEPGVDFNLSDLAVTIQGPGMPAALLDPIDAGDVFTGPLGDATQRYQLRLPLTQSVLFGSSPALIPPGGITYTITLSNSSPVTPLAIDVVGIVSGSIPPGEPVVLDYARMVCGNNPDPSLGCHHPLSYFRLNEPAGVQVLDYATGETGWAWNFGNVAGSQLGAPGPRPPEFPGLEAGNLAPEFDGVDDWITAFRTPGLRSITALVKPGISAPGTIVSQYDPAGDRRAFSLTTEAGGQVALRVSQDGRGAPLHEAKIVSSEPLPIGTWTQVTANLIGGGMRLCFDGREVAARGYGVPTDVPDSGVPLSIGTAFRGQIDEVAFSGTAMSAPHCEAAADQYLGTLASAFGRPVTGNGGVAVRRNTPRGVEIGEFDDSGSAFASFDVSGADVVEQGFNFRVVAEDLSIFRSSVGVGVGGTVGLGFATVTSIGQSRGGLAASFGTLGVPNVSVSVLAGGVPVGSFTRPTGPVGIMQPLPPLVQLGVLDGANPWGFRMIFAGNTSVTPQGGGAALTGDEIRFTAPGVTRESLPPITNVDVGGFSIPKVEILDAAVGPLPELVLADVDDDGDVDANDLEEVLARLDETDPPPGFDLDGDGRIGQVDVRLLIDRFGLGSSGAALAAATAAPLAPPLLALQTATPAVQVGQPVALDLVLSGLVGTVGGFALEVRYDDSAFALDDVSFGTALGSLDGSLDHSIDPGAQTAVFAFDTPGAVQLYVLSLLDAAQLAPLQSATLTLASLEFTALAPATAAFDAATVDMVDGAQPPADLAPLTQGVQVDVSCANGDGDALCDAADNCPFFSAIDVADTDGDGRGDACECSDQNGDGENTVSDLLAINVAIFNPAQATELCDGTGDGNCDVNDLIAANVEIFSPTSTSICPRQPVPGP